jgi:thiamine biosynthesis lipoprotein
MEVYSHSFWAMNTRFVMIIPGIDEHTGHELAKGAEFITEVCEQRLSRFREGSELSRLNKLAFENQLSVSPEMAQVIDACHHYYLQTKGLFDPAYSPVYDLLNTANQRNSEAHLKLHQQCGWKQILWNNTTSKVKFLTPEVKLDFGGIGKGFAIKEVAGYLKKNDIKNAFLSFGESAIAGIGSHPYGDYWPVANSSLLKDEKENHVFQLKDEFLSVSGLHQKDSDMAKAHIYHPIKAMMLDKTGEIMVKSHCPVEAEVLSTAGYIANDSQREILKASFPDSRWHYNNDVNNTLSN